MSLLEQFAQSELIHSLTIGEKVMGTVYVTLLGMSITFVALFILMVLLILVSKFMRRPKPPGKIPLPLALLPDEIDEELIAVLSAACASLKTPVRVVRARRLKQIEDDTPSWGKRGRV